MRLNARPVTWADCARLYRWANDPLTRRMSFHSEPIPLVQHEAWLRGKLADPRAHLFILEGPEGEPVGQARFDLREARRAEISFSLAPEARGRGLAAPAIERALQALAARAATEEVVAFIKLENLASIRAFERAGFGHRHLTARGDQRVLRLSRAPYPRPEDRLRHELRSALAARRQRWRAELGGEPPLARLEAVALLAALRPLARRLAPAARARWYRRLSERHPGYFRAQSFLAYALEAAGDLDAAAEVFLTAWAEAPSDAGVLEGLGRVHRRLGRELPLEIAIDRAERQPLSEREGRALVARLRTLGHGEEAERLSQRLWTEGHPTSDPALGRLTRLRARVLRLSEDAPSARPLLWALEEHARASVASAPLRPGLDASGPSRPRVPQQDVVELLNELERRLPVDGWSVDGVAVWPVLRAQLGAQLLAITQDEAPRAAPPPTAPTGSGAAAPSVWERWSRLRAHGVALHPAEVLFVGHDAQRQALGGRRHDRHFDPLRDVLDARGCRSLHLESVRDDLLGEVPPVRPSVNVQPVLDRILRAAPRRLNWQLELAGWPQLVEQLAPFAEALGPRPWLEPGPERWATGLASIFETARYFDWVLARVKPRLVFLTVYYSTLGFGLCLAAARRGIPVVDLQHGMNTRHYAYEAWTRVPAAGYPLLPSVFWTWSPRDAERISSWARASAGHHRAVCGGQPWGALLAAESGREGRDRPVSAPARTTPRVVLVSLNWSCGFAEVFKAVMLAADPNITWWVRLHPIMRPRLGEVVAWCREHLAGPHEVERVTELPLAPLLEAADVHLTLSSSVTQEATRAGLPSVCLEPRSQWLYAEEIASGWVRYVSEGPSQVLAALEAQAQRRRALPRWEPLPDAAHVAKTLLELLDSAAPVFAG